MRLSIVIGSLLAVGAALGLLIWFPRPIPPAEPGPAGAVAATGAVSAPISAPPAFAIQPAVSSASVQPQIGPSLERVQARMAELMDLAMNDDPASREQILAELTSPYRAIRRTAVEAIKQFGDRSVTNYLHELAERTDDPEERTSLLEAAEFISLPSLAERYPQAPTNTIPRPPRATNAPSSRPVWPIRPPPPAPQSAAPGR